MSENLLGRVSRVDTGNITIDIMDETLLNSLQVNHLVEVSSSNTNQTIIALITKIIRKFDISNDVEDDDDENNVSKNIALASMVGTFFDKDGMQKNTFKRTLTTIPSINAECRLLKNDNLQRLMQSISSGNDTDAILSIGKYVIADNVDTNLDGNKFFQRHAIIVGSTGSGKSYTVSTLLEKSSELSAANHIVFDIHNEYHPLRQLSNVASLKIASPSDNTDADGLIFLPYWLFDIEEIGAILLDRDDNNAPNQARVLFDNIISLKKEKLQAHNATDILNNFTIDSPVPYNINKLKEEIKSLDEKMVQGKTQEKQGPLHGKLTNFLQRLESKTADKRLNFIFNNSDEMQEHNWIDTLISKLMDFNNNKGIKIIDFSEVPSDILPLVTGMIARLIFNVQSWTDKEKRHPIALFCDEAHLYIPAENQGSISQKGLFNFERIAKEGRKYAISLVIISQRPADVSKTVLSQCNNFIVMKLTNPHDQQVIKNLFPDNLGNFADLLPILDTGEAIIIGDACLLPSRVKISKPKIEPDSATIDFWNEWKDATKKNHLKDAVHSLRKQSKV